MSYIETKIINGKEYMYLRHSLRLPGGKVVHKNVNYLGPIKPIYKRKKERSDNSWLFVRELREEDRKTLEKSISHQKGFTRDRAKVV